MIDMIKFTPTHEITITNQLTHQQETIPVMLVDGNAYTELEWDTATDSDWTYDEHGWRFQGFAAPIAQALVSVRRV